MHLNSAASSACSQAVQRDVKQQERIEQGLKRGALNKREAARLERKEARAGANGRVGPHEERSIQRSENCNSRRIFRRKRD